MGAAESHSDIDHMPGRECLASLAAARRRKTRAAEGVRSDGLAETAPWAAGHVGAFSANSKISAEKVFRS